MPTPIEKNLHFVWLGGPIGEAREAVIKRWATQNPNWQVMIWIDSRHLLMNHARKHGSSTYKDNQVAQKCLVGIIKYLQAKGEATSMSDDLPKKLLSQHGSMDLQRLVLFGASSSNYSVNRSRVHAGLVMGTKRRIGCNNVRIMDLWHEEVVNKRNVLSSAGDVGGALEVLFHSELLFRLNPGAASDILRLCVLRAFGGLYLDVDVEPKKPLGTWSSNWPEGAHYAPLKEYINNNAIAAVSGSAGLLAVLKQIFTNYIGLGKDDGLRVTMSGGYDALTDLESATVNMSGPIVADIALGWEKVKNARLPKEFFEFDTELAKEHDYATAKNVDA